MKKPNQIFSDAREMTRLLRKRKKIFENQRIDVMVVYINSDETRERYIVHVTCDSNDSELWHCEPEVF